MTETNLCETVCAPATTTQFSEMTSQSAHRETTCPECGKVRTVARIYAMCRELLPDVDIMCDECVAIREKRERNESHAQAVKQHYWNLVNSGAIRKSLARVSFQHSDPKHEGRNKDAWNIAHNWTPHRDNIYAWGNPNSGKTWLARCILNRAMWSLKRVAEATALDIAKQSRLFDRGRLWDIWREADILLIDDLDKPDFVKETLPCFWELFDRRAETGKTIVTSNMTKRALFEKMKAECQNESLPVATLRRLRPITNVEMK